MRISEVEDPNEVRRRRMRFLNAENEAKNAENEAQKLAKNEKGKEKVTCNDDEDITTKKEDDSDDDDEGGPSEGPKLPRMMRELAISGILPQVAVDTPRQTRSKKKVAMESWEELVEDVETCGDVNGGVTNLLIAQTTQFSEDPADLYGLLVNSGPASMA